MLTEVMEFYGLERDFQAAGFFETEQHRQLMKAIRPALLSGKLVAVTGPVGSGKTLFLRRFETALADDVARCFRRTWRTASLSRSVRPFPGAMAMDRLAAMETFVRVVETGSFSAAARILDVGQPAVSKTVAQLEVRLGVRLLMRSTHGLSPTDAGQNFYDHAKQAIQRAEEAELAARGAGASLSGRLRISAAVT